jgi:hypothetical protein
VVQEKHYAVIVVRKVIDSLNEFVTGVLGLGFTLLFLSFGFGVENIQNQNNRIGQINVVVAEAILDGGDIFSCLVKNLGVKEVGISVYFLRHKFEQEEHGVEETNLFIIIKITYTFRVYVFDPTGWWNRPSQHLINQETSKRRRILYLIKSLCKGPMVIEVGFFLLILKLLYFSLRL